VRSLVATAVPLALRDELARLIPGFDPAGASLAGRAATLPLAVKLATAAVSVGVITTGAAQLSDDHAPSVVRKEHPRADARHFPSTARHVARLPTVQLVAERSRSHETEHRSGDEAERHARGDPSPEEQAAPDSEPATVERAVPESHDMSSDDRSGPTSETEPSTGDN
jgi:hypothetical protein